MKIIDQGEKYESCSDIQASGLFIKLLFVIKSVTLWKEAMKNPVSSSQVLSEKLVNPFSVHGEFSVKNISVSKQLSSYEFTSARLKRNGKTKKCFNLKTNGASFIRINPSASLVSTAQLEAETDVEVAEGYTMTQFCDKMIDYFMNEKPQTKDWKKLLVFRDDWNKYKNNFYNRLQMRIETESDSAIKQKLAILKRKIKKVDDEIERHSELLKEIQENPMDINAVVARCRKDFTGEFFHHLSLLSETRDSLEDRDAIVRLGAKCLSAIRAYDNAIEDLNMLSAAQTKFDDILNSPSLDLACEKIKSLAKSKELDSSLILLINKAWAAAKESTTMKSEVKNIMYHLYKTTKRSLKSMAPKEFKLLKYLLNIVNPEERFSALAVAFTCNNESEVKDDNVIHTSPKELLKWITIMLDAYHLNKEETDIREARQMSEPMVIQRLFILKETIEEEYMKRSKEKEDKEEAEE